MNITIHRGTNQIGGCVTEYEHNGWRVFVDYGEQLPGSRLTPLSAEGLTHGDLSKSILLITHYHGDHAGSIADLPKELPIFMGATAKEILEAYSEHVGHVDDRHKRLNLRLKTVKTFSPGNLLKWGDFQIMPVTMDHSAFDAYAFMIEAAGLKVFHTGDFRSHGFRSKKLPQIIDKYIGKVDYLICEATNAGRPEIHMKSEPQLHMEFTREFQKNKSNVVYMSSTNIDRLFSLYHAALKAHRPFYVDSFQKKIMDIIASGKDAIWGKSSFYKYKQNLEPRVLYSNPTQFKVNDKFIDFLSEHGYVIAARASSKYHGLLSKIPAEGRKTYLSMWKGYVDKSSPAFNPSLAESLPATYEYFHTSGHCDMGSLKDLAKLLSPKAIIPLHTDSPDKFTEFFYDEWPVILMRDSETFAPIKDQDNDNLSANIIARESLIAQIQIKENPVNQKVWSLDRRCLGEFRRKEDAMWALRHVVYAPTRTIGFSIEEDEDMWPWHYQVFDNKLNLLSTYTYGEHEPHGKKWQERSRFSPGESVYAIENFCGQELLIPAEVIGPVTEEFIRQQFEEDEYAPSTFEEYLEWLYDWDWDTVIVRPQVRLNHEDEEMPEYIRVNRVYLFPKES